MTRFLRITPWICAALTAGYLAHITRDTLAFAFGTGAF